MDSPPHKVDLPMTHNVLNEQAQRQERNSKCMPRYGRSAHAVLHMKNPWRHETAPVDITCPENLYHI